MPRIAAFAAALLWRCCGFLNSISPDDSSEGSGGGTTISRKFLEQKFHAGAASTPGQLVQHHAAAAPQSQVPAGPGGGPLHAAAAGRPGRCNLPDLWGGICVKIKLKVPDKVNMFLTCFSSSFPCFCDGGALP